MKIDVHNHIGYDPAYDVERKSGELIKEMDKAGVDKCIVFPFTSNPDLKSENKKVKSAIEAYPERIIGFFTMNPKLDNFIDLMYNYKEQGFAGVVTDPRFGLDHSAKLFHEMMECAFVLDLPVWLHSDDKDTMRVYISSLEGMLSKYGNISFILSSMYYDSTGIATRHRNTYLDTATAMSGSMTASVTQPVGTHRVLMGSNTPDGLLVREIQKIEETPELSAFQKKLILGENARRLLKL